MSPPNAVQTARERARAELTREITEEARRQLAEVGAHGLSLRAVARELGMVSSALYRYFPSRDDLLTALIIDAYDAIGSAAEAAIAVAGGAPARERWAAACRAIRAWAVARPHEYALIYGSPVPGYQAPEATVGPASRVPLAFASVLADAAASGALPASAAKGSALGGGPLLGDPLADQAAALSSALSAALSVARPAVPAQAAAPVQAAAAAGACPVPADMLVRAVIAWTQLFGMISFELFGQFVGSFEPADAFFEHAVAQLTAFVGL
jgi:AcrR family transcriptional regulator